jgi:hypothetical protein
MRLFEAILIVLAGQYALAAAVMGGRRPKWANLLPLVLLAPLAAHLALEGARWQMAPAYLATIGLGLEGIVRYARAPRDTVPAEYRGAKSAEYRGAAARIAPTVAGITGFLLLMLSAAAVAFSR